MTDYLDVSSRIRIPHSEFQLTFSRSPGPGGQNVNKLNTKVRLAWPLDESSSLSDEVKARVRQRWGNRINKQGELVINSSRFRDQRKNVNDCLDKLREMILLVEFPPKPRKPTKKTRSSVRRRLNEKRQRGELKQQRRGNRRGDAD